MSALMEALHPAEFVNCYIRCQGVLFGCNQELLRIHSPTLKTFLDEDPALQEVHPDDGHFVIPLPETYLLEVVRYVLLGFFKSQERCPFDRNVDQVSNYLELMHWMAATVDKIPYRIDENALSDRAAVGQKTLNEIRSALTIVDAAHRFCFQARAKDLLRHLRSQVNHMISQFHWATHIESYSQHIFQAVQLLVRNEVFRAVFPECCL